MIDDLAECLVDQKRSDLVNSLNDKRVEQSLPAEMELALIWMLKSCQKLEIEPDWWPDGRKPDVYVEGLIPEIPAVIEVTAVADNSMSGEKEMDHCVRKIGQLADSIEKGVGDYLFFQFAETRPTDGHWSERGIAATTKYEPSDQAKRLLENWLHSEISSSEPLKFFDGDVYAHITRKTYKHSRYSNFHVSRPPRVYCATKNPIYKALSKKLAQVENAPAGVWRIIFLAEAGSRVLADLNGRFANNGVEQHFTAQEIINRFVSDKRGRVDAVVAFVPIKKYHPAILARPEYERAWGVTVFGEDSAQNRSLVQRLDKVLPDLPKPNFTGSNARSLTRQRALRHDARGWYLPTKMNYSSDQLTYRVSLRVFQDFLARRITEEQFRDAVGQRDDGPSMARFLQQGFTVQSARFEAGGVDRDDDYMVLEFARDAAAWPFE